MGSSSRWMVGLVMGLVTALVAGGCSLVRPTAPPPLAMVKVVTVPLLSYAPLYLAQEEGYFVEQNLQVEFVKLAKSADALPSLSQGQVDVVAGAVSFGVLNSVARGARVRLVADKGYNAASGCAYNAILVRRSLAGPGAAPDPALLRGRRVAANPASVSGYVLDRWLHRAGLSLDDVATVDLPDATIVEALAKGSIDAAAVAEPIVTQALKTGSVDVWASAQQVIPDYPAGVLLYGPTLLDDRPEVGERFMAAYLKAVRQYSQGKTERNLDIVARVTGLDRQLVREMCWPAFRDDGRVSTPSVLDFQAWGVAHGHLDTRLEPGQFWEPRFIERAAKTLGSSGS